MLSALIREFDDVFYIDFFHRSLRASLCKLRPDKSVKTLSTQSLKFFPLPLIHQKYWRTGRTAKENQSAFILLQLYVFISNYFFPQGNCEAGQLGGFVRKLRKKSM